MSACCAAASRVLISEWAATNPVAFYGLTELACRTPCASGLSIAALAFRAPGDWALTRQQAEQQEQQHQAQGQLQQQALLNTWPEYKAYISAVASWCKAHVKLFPEACEAALQKTNIEQYKALTPALLTMLPSNDADGAGCLGLDQAPGSSSPTLQAVRLVLLLWLARATLGFLNYCLNTFAPQHRSSRECNSSSSSSSSSRECNSSSSSSSSRDGNSSSASRSGFGGACEPAKPSSNSIAAMSLDFLLPKCMVALGAPVLHALVNLAEDIF